MIVAIDVHYSVQKARAVSIEFEDWQVEKPKATHIIELEGIAEYIPGQFYKRELPCILEVLKKSDLSKVEVIIIDGYVVLNDKGKAGLGTYLYQALKQGIPIIGVAKTSFHNNQKLVIPVLRGESKKPIYVTAIGMPLKKASSLVEQMHGDFRMPTLLTILDRHTKEWGVRNEE